VARTRSGQDLINDAQRRADVESATDRHPRADILRYINQGCAEVYDLIVQARGKTYFRATPQQITLTGGTTTRYQLDPSFYRLISARVKEPSGYRLLPFTVEDEPWLRETNNTLATPTHYEIQPGYIELLPQHGGGRVVVVDYIPVFTDLSDSTGSTFDGIDGWEEYAVLFAAKNIADKDENWELSQAVDAEMTRMRGRIQSLAGHRDNYRAERVKDVRGDVPLGMYGRGRWMR